MGVREIPRSEWQEFLAGFGSRHRAWLTTVASGEPLHVDVAERPLQSVTAIVEGNRVVSIDIRFHDAPGAPELLRVRDPAAVRVDEVRPGTARGLEIVDEAGVSTRLRFRAVQPPEMLDGLAPGELP